MKAQLPLVLEYFSSKIRNSATFFEALVGTKEVK